MDEQTNKDQASHSCCSGGMCGMCCHKGGRFSLLRVLLGLVVVILIFAFGFALGRMSGFSHFRGGFGSGNMMYYRGNPTLQDPGYQYQIQTQPSGMMRFYAPQAASTTPTK